jgi:DNA helicase-2/ATP-dependent DNA helicase PcrA
VPRPVTANNHKAPLASHLSPFKSTPTLFMSGFTGTLNPQQRQAATHINGPLLILAGAGTGKTRVVTARIAHMVNEGIRPENILSVTFTNKAAAEMRERVQDMVRGSAGKKVVLGTFHAFCAKLLREFAEHVGYKKNFVIYSQGDQVSLMKRVLKGLLIKEENMDPQVALSRLSKAKNNAEELGDPSKDLIAAVGEKYADEMRALNAMDFDDLLCLGVKLLEETESVRRTLHERHRYIMVDEFQDTNSLQMRLLRALTPPPFNVCVVGDDDQSIYGWRGAEITNITEFENFFPNPTVVKLEENYRSTTPILHTANSLIVNNIGRRVKSLWSRNKGNDLVRLIATDEDIEEAEMIAKEVETGYYSNRNPGRPLLCSSVPMSKAAPWSRLFVHGRFLIESWGRAASLTVVKSKTRSVTLPCCTIRTMTSPCCAS